MIPGLITSVLTEEEYGRVLSSMRAVRSRLDMFQQALLAFNRTINLVSRKYDPEFFDHHILHSLALACRGIPSGFRVVDWGAGGGIPSLPLATAFSEVDFLCVDKVDKKMRAVRAMARQLDIGNVTTVSSRAEDVCGPFDLSISRATAPLSVLWTWHLSGSTGSGVGSVGESATSGETIRRGEIPEKASILEPMPRHGNIAARIEHASESCNTAETVWKRGLVCLKGGNLTDEISELVWARSISAIEIIALAPVFEGEYFRDKKIVTIVQE